MLHAIVYGVFCDVDCCVILCFSPCRLKNLLMLIVRCLVSHLSRAFPVRHVFASRKQMSVQFAVRFMSHHCHCKDGICPPHLAGCIMNSCAPQVTLSRFDLSSAAMFLDSANNDCGLLFRARFFPKEDENNFPFNLGFCQIGSNIEFDQNSMDFRNFLWFKVRDFYHSPVVMIFLCMIWRAREVFGLRWHPCIMFHCSNICFCRILVNGE